VNPLPPGPRSIDPVAFLRVLVAPLPVFQNMVAEYGDTFRAPTLNGPFNITCDPDAIRTIYTADPDSFDAFGAGVAEPVFGTTSIVVSSGARHKRDRKLLTPPFNATSIRAYSATIAEIAAQEAARWTPGRSFSMLEATQSIALDIIVRLVFGVEGRERIRIAREAVLRFADSLSPLIFVFPFLRRDFGGLGPWAKNRRALAALNAVMADEIRARRETYESRNDILSLMMRARYDDGSAMTEVELIDQLRGLLFAGHETTAVSLAWTLYWLHREPSTLERVLAEIDALGPHPDPNEYTSLPYLEAACLEGLRIHPPVIDVGRVPRSPFELARYTIPAGEGICPSPLLLHHREDIYPEPSRFRPSRFLDRKFSPFEYIPFGGGGRRCLGAAFAMAEMKIVLGTLLAGHRFRLASDTPVAYVRRSITMGPRGSIPMIYGGKRAVPPAAGQPRSS